MRSFLIFIFIGTVFLSCSNTQSNEKQRPNIIWLMAEDISTDLECYGMKAVKTPVLNQLADKGVRFDNCFVTNPICSPSRSAMMTGVHQVKINAHNHRSNRNVPLNKNFKPFTYWLRQAGYTCILGHHGVMRKGRKIDVNFKSSPLGEWDGVEHFGLFDKLDTFSVDDQPFFAQIQLLATHRGDWWTHVREISEHPVDPNKVELPEYLADDPVIRLDWAKYLDQIEFIDNEIGMIVNELEEKGMADNTIIVFIGDNGRCNIRGKGYLNDPGLRIPLIVYNPLEKYENRIRKDVVAATDITATILDWAGAELPEYLTGSPIFDEGFNREYSYGARDLWDEIEEKMRSVSTEKWKYIRNDKPELPWDAHQAYLEFYRPALHVMRSLKKDGKLNKDELLFFADSKPREELYDLENDPQELNNLAGNPDYESVLAEMRAKTEAYDKLMEPVDTIYQPEIPSSVAMLEWVKEEKPELYQQMLEGVEIGFQTLGKEFREWKKENK